MIKLLCLGAIPLAAAFFYGEPDAEPRASRSPIAETEDRIFLANLDAQDAASRDGAAERDREFLAKLEDSLPVPVAVAVAVAPPEKLRPIPGRAAGPVSSVVPPRVTPSPKNETPGEQRAPSGPPDPSLSGNGEPAMIMPEVRRAIPVAPHRASILIYGDAVYLSPARR